MPGRFDLVGESFGKRRTEGSRRQRSIFHSVEVSRGYEDKVIRTCKSWKTVHLIRIRLAEEKVRYTARSNEYVLQGWLNLIAQISVPNSWCTVMVSLNMWKRSNSQPQPGIIC